MLFKCRHCQACKKCPDTRGREDGRCTEEGDNYCLAADPAEKVSHAEASGSSRHTSKSTFMMMFDEVLKKRDEPGGIITTSALLQIQTYCIYDRANYPSV